MSVYKIKQINSNYPLLFHLLGGKPFTVNTNVSKDDLLKQIMARQVSFAICQKDGSYIVIRVDGVKSFEDFLTLTGITINGSNTRKASKYLRRAFQICTGAAAYGNFNFQYITKAANAVNYAGNPDDLFACVDGAMFADPKMLTKVWGQPVREHETFLGTVIINGRFSKGKITAKKLATGLDLVTYDIKKDVMFPSNLNYIQLMYKIEPSPLAMTGQAVGWRNPNGSRAEYCNLNLVDSGYQVKEQPGLYVSNLDLQSIINFQLFEFMPGWVQDYLSGILSKLNSASIRELLGGYTESEEVDDRWLLKQVLNDTDIELQNYPGLLRKTQTFFKSSLERLNVFELKEGQKFQVPNKNFTRVYLTPDASAFDDKGIYLGDGKGQLKEGEASINGANLYLNLADPVKTAKILQVMGGADLDGDTVLITTRADIVRHVNTLPKLSSASIAVAPIKNSQKQNPFANFVVQKADAYDERAFLALAKEESNLNLGSIINRFMLLTQMARDQKDDCLMGELTPLLNSIEACIDACIGQDDTDILPILDKLDELMSKVIAVPDFLSRRFLDYDTKAPRYTSYESPDSVYFRQINELIAAFHMTFNQIQASPQVDLALFKPTSKQIDALANASMYRYKQAIQGALVADNDIEAAYQAGVAEVKATYGKLKKNERLEFTTALVNRVYLRATPAKVAEGKQGYPDSILFTTWPNSSGKAQIGPGVALVELLKACKGVNITKANINYDAIMNGATPVELVDGKIMLHDKIIGGSPNHSSGSSVLVKSHNRYYLKEKLEQDILFRRSNFIEAYCFKLGRVDLKALASLEAIQIIPEQAGCFIEVQGQKVAIATKDKAPFSRHNYKIIDSYITKTGRSVRLILC